MRSPTKVLAATVVALAAASAPASAQTASAPEEPVAHIFKFATKQVSTTGAAPQPLIRVDHLGADTVTARLVLTPTNRTGKAKRGQKRISVPLGEFAANQVASPVWPVAKKLNRGYYRAKLNATSADGSVLVREPGSPGTASLKVVKGKPVAVASSIPGLAGRMVGLAQAEVGVTEAPKGSNDSPRIAVYRASTPGGPVGAWCAYFTSWLASTAGAPVGERGQGYGRVDDLYAWAQRNGKAIPGPATPLPGDFMVWDEHIGIVESVAPDGTVTTIDGNYADAVTRRVLPPAKLVPIVGYVRL